MPRLLLTCILLAALLRGAAQSVPFDRYTTDTLRHFALASKKVVAYQLASVTILVDAKEFQRAFRPLYQRYKEGMRGTAKAIRKGEYINPDYAPRYRILDSTWKEVARGLRSSDTVRIVHARIARYELRELIDFDLLIEAGRCLLLDARGRPVPFIVRRKGSWYRGPLAAWGGRRYYLPWAPEYFLAATDWIS